MLNGILNANNININQLLNAVRSKNNNPNLIKEICESKNDK